MNSSPPRFAILAQGRLYLDHGDGVQEVKSEFGEGIRNRAVAVHERNAWKFAGTGARFMGMWMAQTAVNPAAMPIEVSSVARGADSGEFLYTVETPEICGLIKLEHGEGHEQRIWHSNSRRVRDLTMCPDRQRIACTMAHDDGTSGIAIMEVNGSGLAVLTEGDVMDMAPRWVHGTHDELVFQSAGIGRTRDGHVGGIGPFSIHRLSLTSGDLRTVAEDPQRDLLAPQCDAEGRVYFIRRPYRPDHWRPWWAPLLDMVLLPWRILRAVYYFFNYFSLKHTGQPLSADAGAARKESEAQPMVLWGNTVDAQHAMRKAKPEETPDLVPASWELVRRDSDGGETILVRGVLSFDVCADGAILYSNGTAVMRRDADGHVERIVRHPGIEQVIALDGAATALAGQCSGSSSAIPW